MSDATPTLRLDRLLANMGYGSRKDVQALVRYKRVTLDGVPVTDAGIHLPVSPALSQRLLISGTALDPPPGLVVLMHKPLGVTCSHKEAGALVYELLPPRWRDRKPAISTIGRLDKETSGLLLLTDDGAFLHRVIAPRNSIAKRYRVSLARALRGDEAGVLASGTLMLDGEDKPLMPVAMEIAEASSAGEHVVYVTLTEGRYHQVRRMFASLGNHVVSLHRDRVGGMDLPDQLLPGQYRILSPAERDLIFA
ncbi:MAG: pseudouridine synthase [Hyphomicrobium sp.]